jgi:hypothetical protein
MQSDASEEQSINVNLPKIETLEAGSNVNSERLSQRCKQDSEIASIDEGMQTDSMSDLHTGPWIIIDTRTTQPLIQTELRGKCRPRTCK